MTLDIHDFLVNKADTEYALRGWTHHHPDCRVRPHCIHERRSHVPLTQEPQFFLPIIPIPQRLYKFESLFSCRLSNFVTHQFITSSLSLGPMVASVCLPGDRRVRICSCTFSDRNRHVLGCLVESKSQCEAKASALLLYHIRE